MSKIIRRLGTKPVKFEFVIAFDEVKMSVDLDGVMLIRWVRGPRTATSMEAEGKHGLFKWRKEDQARKPTRMICTLYKNRGLGEYQKKKSLLIVKQRIGDTMLTVGEVELDLANFVMGSGESSSRMMNEAIHKCSDKKARVKFTITSRDVTKQHDTGNDAEISGLTGGLDDEEDYFDPDGRADYENLELASGEDEESEPEEKPPEDQVDTSLSGTVALTAKPQVLSFVDSDEPQEAPLPVTLPLKREGSRGSTETDLALQTKIRELDTKIWQLTKHSGKVEKELMSARDQYAKHLETLEQNLAATTTQFEAKEKLATELSHKLEATLVDLEMETARVRSFARLLDMQRSQIEAAEAEAATFQARAGELQNRLHMTEASLRTLTEQKPGVMAQLTSSKRVKELEELVAAKDHSIKFYEAQLESSDKTMLAAKDSWDNSSRLLLQEISSAEAAFKKTKELLHEATSEAGHFSDVERQFKRAIADRLKMSELLTQYECTITQKDLELQQLQLQLVAKDGARNVNFVQSRESSLRGMESPLMTPTAFSRPSGDEPRNTPATSPSAFLGIPSAFALNSPSLAASNPFGSEEGTSSAVIHIGALSLASSTIPSTSSSLASTSSLPASLSPSLNPFAPSASSDTVSSENSTNPFDLSTNPFDVPKNNSLPSSCLSSSSSNPFEETSSETSIPTITIIAAPAAIIVPTPTPTTTPSPSLTSSLTSSFSSLFRKTSKASSTAAAAAAAVASSPAITNSPTLTSTTSPSLSSITSNLPTSASTGSFAATPNFSSSSDSPSQSESVTTVPPRLCLKSESPSPPPRISSSEDRPEFPRRASSAGVLREVTSRPSGDLARSVSGGSSGDRRKRSEDFDIAFRSSFEKLSEESTPAASIRIPSPEQSKSPRSQRSLGISFATSAEGTTSPEASRSPRWMSRGLLFSSTEPGKNFELPAPEISSPSVAPRSLASISERDDLSPSGKAEELPAPLFEKGLTRANSKPATEAHGFVVSKPARSSSEERLISNAHTDETSVAFSTSSSGPKSTKRPPPPPPGVSTPPITSVAGVEIPALPQPSKDEPFEEF